MSILRRVNRSTTRAVDLMVSLLAVGVLAVLGIWNPDLVVPILIAVGVMVTAMLFVSARRSTRRIMTQLSNLRVRIDRVHAAQTGVLPGANPPATGGSLVSKRQTVPNSHPLAEELAKSGIFCADFYAKARGKRFVNINDAASHYLIYSLRHLFPPNPFVDINVLPETIQEAARSRDAKTFLSHITSADTELFGPAFDPRFVSPDTQSEMSLLGQFVSTADSATLLPVHEDSPLAGVTVKTYADTVVSFYQLLLDERALRASRVTDEWDKEAEAAWKTELHAGGETARPLVSIVMPVKDRAVLVRDAIASAQAQTYPEWSLIVIDDHSTDDTFEVLQELASRDSRITVLSNTGAGVSAARNVGIQAATGKYIAFLDSDNTWEPDYLECMIRAMLRDGLDWAYSASRIIGGSEYPIAYMAHEGGRDHLLYRNHIDINVMMASAELIDRVNGFDESLKRWVDYDMVLRMTEYSSPVLMPFIGCNYDHAMDRNDRITVKESGRWRGIVFGNNLVNWQRESNKKRVAGRVSVIIPTFNDSAGTIAAVESIVTRGGLDDVEIIVVDGGSSHRESRMLSQHFSCRDNIRLVRLVRNYRGAIGNNYGFVESTGEYVLFVNSRTRMRSGALADLLAALDDEEVIGVNPLLVKENDAIFSAGLIWAASRTMPLQFLEDHPREDAHAVAGYDFSAARGAGLVMRSSDFAALNGFHPIYNDGMEDVDLTLRAKNLRNGAFRVVSNVALTVVESAVVRREKELADNQRIFMDEWRNKLLGNDLDLISASGFEILQLGMDSSIERVAEAGTSVTLGRIAGSPRRWAIKNPADKGVPGDSWGDTHFIDSFAQSLRSEGQEVVTFRRGAHSSPSTKLDDVTLVIRGLFPSSPNPGKVNILWIISHPDKITAGELAAFDIVYAASHSWARWATEEYGVEVRPLLQATDSTRFNYVSGPKPPSCDVVFVGGHFKKRDRKVVLHALDADVDLRVYGPNWNGIVPEQKMGGLYVENDQLADVYRDAHFVLADHWELMAAEGFIQNRIFDAVASGCRVITDPVKDLREVFGAEVLVASNAEDIQRHVHEALNADVEALEALRREAAENVLANHTFDARARQVIEDVEALEARRSPIS